LYRIPSYYRIVSLCIRIWCCPPCFYVVQRRDWKTTSVYWLTRWTYSYEFDDRLVSQNFNIPIGKSHCNSRSQNIQTVVIARFLAGGCGSTGATMVGGTIADIWRPHEFVCAIYNSFRHLFSSRRSLPMAIYSLVGIGGTGLGPAVAGWVEMNPHLQWRWIQWIHMVFVVLLTAILSH
jgi:MFS family permease